MPHPKQIPLTPQTDEENFPRWDARAPFGRSGHPWPHMLVRPCTAKDREEWSEKNRKVDRVTRESYWDERPPKVGDPIPILATPEVVAAGHATVVGENVICRTREDEEEVRKLLGVTIDGNGEAPPPPVATVPENILLRLEAIAEENRQLKEALARIEVANAEKPRRGRPRADEPAEQQLVE